MGFIPGARLPLGDVNKDVGSRPRVFIGSGSGVHGGDQALLGQFNSAFGKTEYKGLHGNVRPGGSGSFVNQELMDKVLDRRRFDRLAAADPGLSTRGTRGAPGRGARPVGGGLEGRGSRAMPGSRMAPGPMHGPGRAELAGVNRGRAAQRSRVLGNLDANRARAGSGAGASRADALAGKRQELLHGRRQRVLGNIEASRAGRTGPGYREAMNPILGPGRTEQLGVMRGRREARMGSRSVSAQIKKNGANHRPLTHTPVKLSARKPLTAAAESGASGAAKGGKMMQFFGNMSTPSKVGIGLGLAVAAGVMSNKRGDGASSGRQSTARY